MIQHPDDGHAVLCIDLSLARAQSAILLMEGAFRAMTPAERAGAEAARVPATYEGLKLLESELADLRRHVAADAPPSWASVLKDWREAKRVAGWVSAASAQHLVLVDRGAVREALRDKFTLLASTAAILAAEAIELEVVLRAVMLEDAPTAEDPVMEPDPMEGPRPPEDSPLEPVPAGVNPIAWALDRLRDEIVAQGGMRRFSALDVLRARLPAGSYKGLAVGARNWTGLDRYEPWWGEAMLVLEGSPDGTVILPCHDEEGWGSSFIIEPSAAWAGRLELSGVTLVCSGSAGVSGGAYGTTAVMPLRDVRFTRVHFKDHPLVQAKWVTSFNQARVRFEACRFDAPRSKEHGCYLRNGLGLEMVDCTSTGLGGQVVQKLSRPSEGPTYGVTPLAVHGGDFRGFHRWPERAGSAFTACEGDVLLSGVTISDVGRAAAPPPDGVKSHGGFVAWDGGAHYKQGGGAKGGALRTVRLVDCDLVFEDPDRGPAAFDSADEVHLVNCGLWSSNGKPILVGSSSPVGRLVVKGCNSPAARARAAGKGFDPALLKEGRVLWGPTRVDLGPTSGEIDRTG